MIKSSPQTPSLAAEISAAFVAALTAAAPSRPAAAAAPAADPWEAVRLSEAQTTAITRTGWLAAGWKPSKENQKERPAKYWRSGPVVPNVRTIADRDPDGLINLQVMGMICAKLHSAGKVHVGDCAILVDRMGCRAFASPVEFSNRLKQVVGGQSVNRTADGWIECNLKQPQSLHEAYLAMCNKVLTFKG